MLNKNTYIFVFILALFFIIISPHWLSEGMFLDGLIYASISRNFSLSENGMWDFSYTLFADKDFTSQPPLVFWILGFLYCVFGDSIYVEKVFSVLTYLISGYSIVILWNLATDKQHKEFSWIPLLFYLSFPVVSWASVNNLLENLMTSFLLLSLVFIVKSIEKKKILHISIASFSLFLAVLCKGIPALFISTSFFWIWVLSGKIKFKTMVFSSSLLLFFLICFSLLMIFSNDEALSYFSSYFEKQFKVSINQTYYETNRWYILIKFFEQIMIALSSIVILLVIFRKKVNNLFKNEVFRESVVYFLIGLSGILPYLLIYKQRTFYLTPSMPFIALSFGLFSLNIIKKIELIYLKKKLHKVLKYISVLFLMSAVILNIHFSQKIGRDKEIIEDVNKIASIIGEKSSLTIDKKIFTSWSLHAYFMRLHRISISDQKEFDYLITYKQDTCKNEKYQKLDVNLNNFFIYKKTSL